MISFDAKKDLRRQHPMRIVVPTPLYGGSLPISRHAAIAFESLGHEVKLIDFEDQNALFKRCEALRSSVNSSVPLQASVAALLADVVAASAIEYEADLVWFTAQSPVSNSALAELCRAGIRTVMWFVEDFRRYDYWKMIAPNLDLVFTIQRENAKEAMQRYGVKRVEYLPLAANTNVHHPQILSGEQYSRFGSAVSFVGAGYPNRVEFFSRRQIEGLRLWGNDWPSNATLHREEDGRRVTPEETALIYNATDVNINLHSAPSGSAAAHGDFVNPRTFEIAACRAFQICDVQEPLAELFDLGKEMIAVGSDREMREAIDFYRGNPELRVQIADAAYMRVLKDHTYQRRMEDALKIIEGLAPESRTKDRRSKFMSEMIEAASSDPELANYLLNRSTEGCRSLNELVQGIPAGQRELSRAELMLLMLHEFRQWGIEKGVAQ